MSTFNKGDKVRVAADAKTSYDCDVYFSGAEVEATVIRRDAEDVLVEDSKGHSQFVAPEYLTLIEEPDVVQYRHFDTCYGGAYYRVEKVEGEDKYLVDVLHMFNGKLSETTWYGEANIRVTEDASERKEWIEQCIKEGKVIPHISEFTVGSLWHSNQTDGYYEVTEARGSQVWFDCSDVFSKNSRLKAVRQSYDLQEFEPADAQATREWFEEPEDSLAGIVKALDVEVQVVSAEDSPTVSIQALREAYGYLEDVEYLDIDKLIELAKRLS